MLEGIKHQQPLSRKLRLKATQLFQQYNEDWRSYVAKFEHVYIIDEQSFYRIKGHLQKGTKCDIGYINQSIIAKNDDNNFDKFSENMLIQGLSLDSTAPSNRVRVVSCELNFFIFNHLGCSGEQVRREVVQTNQTKTVELYPNYIEFQVLSTRKLKAMYIKAQNSSSIIFQPNEKHKIACKQKQKGSEIYQKVHRLVSRYQSIKQMEIKIYVYNPNLFKRIKIQRKLYYYMAGEDVRNIATAQQSKFYKIIDNNKYNQFDVQFFAGKLLKKQQQINLKSTDKLIVELFLDGKWVFPEQPDSSITKKCAYCNLFAQLYLQFNCKKCNQQFMFCTRVCHFQGLMAHLCNEGRQTLSDLYGAQDIMIQQIIRKRQRKSTGNSDDQGSQIQIQQDQKKPKIAINLHSNQLSFRLPTNVLKDNNTSSQVGSSSSGHQQKKSTRAQNNKEKSVVPPPLPYLKPQKEKQITPAKTSINGITSKWTGGIVNLGNTCYMNASLQAIIRTELAKDIMSIKQFDKITTVKAFAALLRQLQNSNQNFPVQRYAVEAFKQIIDQKINQFIGYEQQDAHQFLMSFLDKLHDQLNRNSQPSKFNFTSLRSDSYPFNPELQAKKQWIEHVCKHNSPIVDMFYGQQMQTTECPNCHHKSVKFAPFSSISCSIQTQTQLPTFYIYYEFANNSQKRSRLQVVAKGYVSDLLNQLQKKSKTLAQRSMKLNFFVTGSERQCKEIEGTTQLGKFANQNRPRQRDYELFIFESQKLWSSFLIFKFNMKDKILSIKRPLYFKEYFTQIKNKTLYRAVEKYFKDFIKINLKPKAQLDFNLVCQKMSEDMQYFFSLSLHVNGTLNSSGKIQFQKGCNLPFSQDLLALHNIDSYMVNQVWIQLNSLSKKRHQTEKERALQIFTQCILQKINKYVPDNSPPVGGSVTSAIIKLEDCLKEQYDKKSILDQKNLWYCPLCNEKRRAHLSSSLYKVGRYLIIHIKRFKKHLDGAIYQKNRAKILPPLQLDLKGLLLNPDSPQSYYKDLSYEEIQSLRVQKVKGNENGSYLFVLKGVIIHDGDIEKGHYIALVLQDQQWFIFNDQESYVVDIGKKIEENLHKIYVLIYERAHQTT